MNPSIKTMSLIHYGTAVYDPTKFEPIRNRDWIKPRGGLWTSPIDSKWGWRDWCISEQFRLHALESHVKLFYQGTTLTIDSEEDMELLDWLTDYRSLFPIEFLRIDFESMLDRGIQAVHLTAKGEQATRWSSPRSLYGWDCETVLILDPSSIRVHDVASFEANAYTLRRSVRIVEEV